MMVIEFTLQNLMFFLACTLGIVAAILVLPILWNIKKVVGILGSLVETNQELIKKAIRTMPKILENVEQISCNVSETTDKLKISVPVILQEIECVTKTAKDNMALAGDVMENMGSEINETMAIYKKDTSDFMTYFHIFEEILPIVFRTFSSKK